MTPLLEDLEDDLRPMDEAQSMAAMTEESVASLPAASAPEAKMKRDDLKNPYWLDDFYPDQPELGGGPVDFLPGTEIVFWNELIKKYLSPLQMTEQQKADQLKALKGYKGYKTT